MDAVRTPYTAEQIRIKTWNKNNVGVSFPKPPRILTTMEDCHALQRNLFPISPASVYINNQYPQSQQQPPLLPLPISAVQQPLLSGSLNGGFSCPPTNRKSRTIHSSLAPKKSKRQEAKRDLEPGISDASGDRLRPDPNCIPLMGKELGSLAAENIETCSGSVFILAPPPSSLPLPKFSLRPKLGCNAQAADVDTRGAQKIMPTYSS